MPEKIDTLGTGWLSDKIENMTDEIVHVTPIDFNETHRYLPESVTSMPGYIRFDVNPYMREIIECCDVNSPVREVNLKKGVQITYTTLLESVSLYYMFHVKTVPMMFVTADKELAKGRIENSFLPMINHSGFADQIRSSDIGNSRKTGKTANHLQWEGGGYLIPGGANNANKMRMWSIMVMLKDEIDAWPDTVGKDGDPDKLTDDRCSGYWERRKIFRGSTPLITGASKIDFQYNRGDKRKYMVLCKKCSFPQELRWSGKNEETQQEYGFKWDFDDNGTLNNESVRYLCQNCAHPHHEHDKTHLFAESHGAHWKPTATPTEKDIRSYHLPALYSPVGMQPWYKSVALWLQAYDPLEKKTKNIDLMQIFYNNVLGNSYTIQGGRVRFESVSLHRRNCYTSGQIPTDFAVQYAEGIILMVTMQVDVHDDALHVAVMGWTKNAHCFVIEYISLDAKKKTNDVGDHCWQQLREMIDEKVYSDGVREYRIAATLIDAGHQQDTVSAFCGEYAAWVYPIIGRDRPAKTQKVKEFSPWKTQTGVEGYTVVVDHYKDRIAPVLRREWSEAAGTQKPYHFNAPMDITDSQLKQLTKEIRRKKTDDKGYVSYYWYRPSGAANELWDLLVYGHAAVEVLAWQVCVVGFELENVDWERFWPYIEENQSFFTLVDKTGKST